MTFRNDNFRTLALLILAFVLAHGVALFNPFYFDDLFVLAENGWLTRGDPSVWFNGYLLDESRLFPGYRPGLMASFWLNARLTGLDTASIRFGNLLLHLANGFLLFFLLRNLAKGSVSRTVILATALLFLIHPLQTLPVNFLWKRSSLLETTFLLLSLFLHARERGRERYRKRAVVWQAALFSAALSVKESALLLPLLLGACDLIFFRPSVRKGSLRLFIPLVLLASAYAWFRFVHVDGWLAAHYRALPNPHTPNPDTHLFTALSALPRYFLLWLLPEPRILDDPLPLASFPWNDAFVTILLLFLSVLISLRWKKVPLLAFSLSIAWIALLPTLLLPLHLPMDQIRLYVPLAGLSFVTAFFVEQGARRGGERLPKIALALLALSYASHSFLQNVRYGNPALIWEDVAVEYPRSDLAWGNLGMALAAAGEPGRAAVAFGMATRIDPSNLGLTILAFQNLLRTGVPAETIRPWLARFPLERLSIPDLVNLGSLAREVGETRLARDCYLLALSQSGNYGPAHLRLAELFESAGETEKARRAFANAVRFLPQSREARDGLDRLSR